MKKLLVFISIVAITPITMANQWPTIEGRMVDLSGDPVDSNDVEIRVEILDPAESCVMHLEEFNNRDLSVTQGGFALPLGSGDLIDNKMDGTAVLGQNVFANPATQTNAAACDIAPDTVVGDGRKVRISYSEDNGTSWSVMPGTVSMGGAPYAQNARTLDGLAPSAFLQDDAGNNVSQAQFVGLLSGARYNKLLDYVNDSAVMVNSNAPSGANDVTNKNYVDNQLAGQILHTSVSGIGAGQDGMFLSWDNTNSRWEMVSPTSTDSTKLPLDGSVAMTGNLQLGATWISNDGGAAEGLSFDASGGATFSAGVAVTNGINSAGDISLQAQSKLILEDDAGGEFIALQAPTGVTSYTMELPNAAGAANQILKLNASGNLVWSADDNAGGSGDINNNGNAGAIILGSNDNSVSLESSGTSRMTIDTLGNANILSQGELRLQDDAGNDFIGLQAPTGVTSYTMQLPNAAGAANQILKLNASGNLVWANDDDTNSGGDINNNGNAGAVIVGSNDNTLALESNNTTALSFDVSQNGFFTGDINVTGQKELRLQDDAGNDYIGLQAPTGVTSYTMQLPNAAPAANQILKADGSGNLQWAADDDTNSGGDLNNGGNAGAVIVGSDDSTLALESNNTTALIFDVSQNGSFASDVNVAGNINTMAQGELRLQDDAGGEYIGFRAPTGVTSYTMDLPASAGAVNQILKLNASGNLIWAADDTGAAGTITDGGNTLTQSMEIGTNDAYDLNLRSNGTDRMVVESDGDINMSNGTLFVDASAASIGIGTDAPGAPIGVYDPNPSLRLVDSDTSAISVISASSPNGSLILSADQAGGVAGSEITFHVDGIQHMRVQDDGNLNLLSENELRFQDASGGEYVGLKAPNAVTTSYSLNLPPAAGLTNQILKLNASGDLVWANDDDSGGAVDLNGLADGRVAASLSSNYLGNGAGGSGTGANNTGMGNMALNSLVGGNNNTAVGSQAMLLNAGGGNNVAVGSEALRDSTSNFNVAVGRGAGKLVSGGQNNVLIGYQAGDTLTTGNNNIVIGSDADVPNASNQLNIGDAITGALNTGDIHIKNELRLDNNAASFHVALKAPDFALSSVTYTLPEVPGASGQFLQTDGSGVLSWASQASAVAGADGAIQYNNLGVPGGDASQFFWDDTNNRLGIHTNSPTVSLDIVGGDMAARDAIVDSVRAHAGADLVIENPSSVQIIDFHVNGSSKFSIGDADVFVNQVPLEIEANANPQIVFVDSDNGANTYTITIPDNPASAMEFRLPATSGVAGDVLKTDGTGNLSWQADDGYQDGSRIMAENGTGAAPAISFDLDPDMGFFRPAANTLAFASNSGTEHMRIDPNGNVGIGTVVPNSKLHVRGGELEIEDGGLKIHGSQGGCNASRAGVTFMNGNGYLEVCKDLGGSNWQWAGVSGRTAAECTAMTMSLVGPPGAPGSFCISASQNGTYNAAHIACQNATGNGYMCGVKELGKACGATVISGTMMAADLVANETVNQVIRFSCTDLGTMATSASASDYHCCID